MPFVAKAAVIQDEPQTWTLLAESDAANGRPVKISFFGGLKFGRVGEPVATEGRELQLASLDDLFGHKLKVLLQRVEIKDYQDIAALIRNGASLAQGLGAASALFGPSFPPIESLRALTYFKEGNVEALAAEDQQTLVAAARTIRAPVGMAIVDRSLTSPWLIEQAKTHRDQPTQASNRAAIVEAVRQLKDRLEPNADKPSPEPGPDKSRR